MLVVGILLAVVVAALAAALFSRRRSHDDEHSVEGYHRQLHTLEAIGVHVVDPDQAPPPGESAQPVFPESAVRVAGTPIVRVTEPKSLFVPPIAPPPVPDPNAPVKFDDASTSTFPLTPGSERRKDRAMSAMNRRPRRLAAPALAVAAVTLLIVVLLVTGSHKVPPVHHQATSTSAHSGTRKHVHVRVHHSTTTTTAPPIISLPTATSTHAATYRVGSNAFTLVLGATSGPCWVDAVNSTTNATLFTAVLTPGEQHSIAATGPVTLEVGAPTSFAGTVDGTAFVLPYGFQTPFTLQFVPISASTT
jgi:hypothetical protein